MRNAARLIDAHIHLDQYRAQYQSILLDGPQLREEGVDGLLAVSTNLESCKQTAALAKRYRHVFPAFGFHPEQSLPSEQELEAIFSFIEANHQQMAAVGEVGLPYYVKRKNPSLQLAPYIELLERFIQLAAIYEKPIVLHAIYEDTSAVCDLLERHNIKNAHFHWYKGNEAELQRVIGNGYFISVTPDCTYELEIQKLLQTVPLHQLMVETDGPWPFKGTFQNQWTHPKMMHTSVEQIAIIKDCPLDEAYQTLYLNTIRFFDLPLG